MFDTRWIRTETPDAEQWRQLGQYRYGPNIRRYLGEHGLLPAGDGIEDYVSGSIGQAEAYFNAARLAPLDISPLLLYYGATSLLSGAAALMRGQPLSIDQHGMAITPSTDGGRISDLEVVVRSTHGSGLQALASVFGGSTVLPGQSKWTVGDLLASLPDLKDDVQLCLPDASPFCLRLERMQGRRLEYERVPKSEFVTRSIDATLARVSGFSKSYLQPQLSGDAVVLYRRLGGAPIGTEALSGQPVLLVAHTKGKSDVTPGQILTQLMALFALGSVSRYHPTLWHPFVHTDATGERLLVERFLALSLRWLPNLVLSAITQHWVRFTSEALRKPRAMEAMTESDLREIVKEMVADAKTP